MGKVTMHNPQSGVTQEASRAAYDRVWSQEGWQLVDTPATEVDADLVAARAEADELGVSYHPKAKAETILAKIAEHKAAEAED